ncbi:hypothetical protein O7047_09305 [Pseudenterobacter timonensis]|uniref:Uncharacterized protein n=1 Tax=Pseudenterobacter timonensis TaxID=1755099 RepID=A0AAE4IVE5_9ENTR|nr:hypothetical protein [Pseudenterobacter timonensis]MDR9890427.1 hypothetical protein [Pseudenterobacter timonensis]
MIKKAVLFFCWLIACFVILPALVPFEWIVRLDDFLSNHGIVIRGSHDFGVERIYDLAADLFIFSSPLVALIMTCLSLKCVTFLRR